MNENRAYILFEPAAETVLKTMLPTRFTFYVFELIDQKRHSCAFSLNNYTEESSPYWSVLHVLADFNDIPALIHSSTSNSTKYIYKIVHYNSILVQYSDANATIKFKLIETGSRMEILKAITNHHSMNTLNKHHKNIWESDALPRVWQLLLLFVG